MAPPKGTPPGQGRLPEEDDREIQRRRSAPRQVREADHSPPRSSPLRKGVTPYDEDDDPDLYSGSEYEPEYDDEDDDDNAPGNGNVVGNHATGGGGGSGRRAAQQQQQQPPPTPAASEAGPSNPDKLTSHNVRWPKFGGGTEAEEQELEDELSRFDKLIELSTQAFRTQVRQSSALPSSSSSSWTPPPERREEELSEAELRDVEGFVSLAAAAGVASRPPPVATFRCPPPRRAQQQQQPQPATKRQDGGGPGPTSTDNSNNNNNNNKSTAAGLAAKNLPPPALFPPTGKTLQQLREATPHRHHPPPAATSSSAPACTLVPAQSVANIPPTGIYSHPCSQQSTTFSSPASSSLDRAGLERFSRAVAAAHNARLAAAAAPAAFYPPTIPHAPTAKEDTTKLDILAAVALRDLDLPSYFLPPGVVSTPSSSSRSAPVSVGPAPAPINTAFFTPRPLSPTAALQEPSALPADDDGNNNGNKDNQNKNNEPQEGDDDPAASDPAAMAPQPKLPPVRRRAPQRRAALKSQETSRQIMTKSEIRNLLKKNADAANNAAGGNNNGKNAATETARGSTTTTAADTTTPAAAAVDVPAKEEEEGKFERPKTRQLKKAAAAAGDPHEPAFVARHTERYEKRLAANTTAHPASDERGAAAAQRAKDAAEVEKAAARTDKHEQEYREIQGRFARVFAQVDRVRAAKDKAKEERAAAAAGESDDDATISDSQRTTTDSDATVSDHDAQDQASRDKLMHDAIAVWQGNPEIREHYHKLDREHTECALRNSEKHFPAVTSRRGGQAPTPPPEASSSSASIGSSGGAAATKLSSKAFAEHIYSLTRSTFEEAARLVGEPPLPEASFGVGEGGSSAPRPFLSHARPATAVAANTPPHGGRGANNLGFGLLSSDMPLRTKSVYEDFGFEIPNPVPPMEQQRGAVTSAAGNDKNKNKKKQDPTAPHGGGAANKGSGLDGSSDDMPPLLPTKPVYEEVDFEIDDPVPPMEQQQQQRGAADDKNKKKQDAAPVNRTSKLGEVPFSYDPRFDPTEVYPGILRGRRDPILRHMLLARLVPGDDASRARAAADQQREEEEAAARQRQEETNPLEALLRAYMIERAAPAASGGPGAASASASGKDDKDGGAGAPASDKPASH